jgi:hypothetical protein
VLTPLVEAFVVTGVLSGARFLLAARGGIEASSARPPLWFSTATWGTAGWWALTIALDVALGLLVWRRPA